MEIERPAADGGCVTSPLATSEVGFVPRRPRSPLLRHLGTAALHLANGALELARRVVLPRRLPDAPAHVVVHRTGTIGDSLCALPALRALRRHWPDARITVLTSAGNSGAPGMATLLDGDPDEFELRPYDHAELASRPAARRLARELRATGELVWIGLPQNLTTPLRELRHLVFARLCGARSGVGFHVGGLQWLARSVARAQSDAPRVLQEADRHLAHLARHGIQSGSVEFAVQRPDRAALAADEALAPLPKGDAPLLVVAPGAKRPANRWPLERFASIARRFASAGGHVVTLGGASEEPLGRAVADAAGDRGHDLCGRTDLLTSAEVLRRARVALTNDSGVMHLAAAVGTPAVVAASARDLPGRWRPHGEAHAVLRREPECSPCWREECPLDNVCLTAVETDAVWSAVERLAGIATSQKAPAPEASPAGSGPLPSSPPRRPLGKP
jgi:ADP-heptose:LPS heptosyltransferase